MCNCRTAGQGGGGRGGRARARRRQVLRACARARRVRRRRVEHERGAPRLRLVTCPLDANLMTNGGTRTRRRRVEHKRARIAVPIALALPFPSSLWHHRERYSRGGGTNQRDLHRPLHLTSYHFPFDTCHLRRTRSSFTATRSPARFGSTTPSSENTRGGGGFSDDARCVDAELESTRGLSAGGPPPYFDDAR